MSAPINNIVFETIPSFLQKATPHTKKTIFTFPNKTVELDDTILLPCLLTGEGLIIKSMKSQPCKFGQEGLFFLDGHLFKNFSMKNNCIFYF